MHAWHFKYEGVLLLNKSSLKHIWSIISSRGKAEKISNWSWIFKAYHNSNLRLNEKVEEILAWIKKKKIQIRVYLEPAHKTETYLRECGIQKHYNYSVTFITHWETWRLSHESSRHGNEHKMYHEVHREAANTKLKERRKEVSDAWQLQNSVSLVWERGHSEKVIGAMTPPWRRPHLGRKEETWGHFSICSVSWFSGGINPVGKQNYCSN